MAETWTSVDASHPEVKNSDTREDALFPKECSTSHYESIQPQEKDPGLLMQVESTESVELELQRGLLSNQELADMSRYEFSTSASPTLSLEGSDLEAPEAVELLLCMEEPDMEEIVDNIPQTTLTPATPLPESPAFTSAPQIMSQALHYLPCPQELPLTSRLAPVSVPAESHVSSTSELTDETKESQISLVSPAEEAPLHPAAPAARSFELPVLLTAGVALAVVGVMAYVLPRK